MQKPLYEIELLHNVDKEFESEFYRYAKTIEYKKGSSPFGSDELLKYFYIVVEGKIKTYRINLETLKEQTLFIYKRGDMFDVVSLLDSLAHEVIYEVLEDCKLLELPMQKVREWLDGSSKFSKMFFPYLSSQMRYMEDLASEISLYDVKERFIHLLLQNIDPDDNFKYNLLQDLSNSEISKILGSVRHVLERAIKELKDDGLVETGRKNIKISNLQKLLEKNSKMLPK